MIGLLPAVRSRRHARGNSQSRKALTVRRAARIRQYLECVSQFLSGEAGRRAAFGPVTSRESSESPATNPTVPFARRATGARDFMDHHGLVREASGHGPQEPSSFTPSFKRPACAGAAPSGRVALGRPSTGQAALPAKEEWWSILGVAPDASSEQAEGAFRKLARLHHPDAGGTHDMMARLSEARERRHDRRSGSQPSKHS